MLELKFQCEDLEEARIYLNAHSMHNLCIDFYEAIHSAVKHDGDLAKVTQNFYEDFAKAAFCTEGVY